MVKKISSFFLFLFILIPFFITNYFFFLKDPPIWPDEPVLFDMAQNFWSTGKIATGIYGDIFSSLEKTSLGYPPLYFIVQGFWTYFFGTSIESIRGLSLVTGFLSLVVFFFITKIVFNSQKLAFLGVFLLSLNVLFSRASRLGRMEILTLFFMLLAFLLILQAQKTKSKVLHFISGTISGLALLCHPMGLLSPVILFLVNLTSKIQLQAKAILTFLLILPVIILSAFWAFLFRIDIQLYIFAYLEHSKDKGSKAPFALTLFQSDFSWWILFVLYIFLVILYFIYTKKINLKIEFPFGIILISTIIISLTGREGGYMVYFQPFMVIITVGILSIFKRVDFSFEKVLILGVVGGIIISNINIQYFNNDNIGITDHGNRSVFKALNYDYHDFTHRLLEILPSQKSLNGQKVNILITNLPDPFFDLKQFNHFQFYEIGTPDYLTSKESFIDLLHSSDYILASWFPNQYLVDYVNNNKEDIFMVAQPDGYNVMVIKLKDKGKRTF